VFFIRLVALHFDQFNTYSYLNRTTHNLKKTLAILTTYSIFIYFIFHVANIKFIIKVPINIFKIEDTIPQDPLPSTHCH
jgi:hypothetical protein